MGILYSAMEGSRDPLFGKFETPIKMLITEEAKKQDGKKTPLAALFNVERSGNFAETVMGEGDFSTFQSVKEGQGAENDCVEKTYEKTIYHIEFMKEFTITRKMADDAKYGIGANFKSVPKKFVSAYYRTQNEIACQSLVHGTDTSFTYNKALVDVSTGDGLSLFNKAHKYANKSGTQSNYYKNGTSTTMTSAAAIETLLSKLANKMRNFKDENGRPMGYVADTVILPCNRPLLEQTVRKAVGTERAVGSANNDVNTQYGMWKIVVLDGWELAADDADKFMIMSSEANENLLANIFYNRVPLDVSSHVDYHTRNYIWNGYCRFGVGFTTWKHILLFDDAETNASATTI